MSDKPCNYNLQIFTLVPPDSFGGVHCTHCGPRSDATVPAQISFRLRKFSRRAKKMFFDLENFQAQRKIRF